MKFAELIVLLPCHSLEDFPVHYEADEAEAVLSAWSALWHPRLIASAAAMPTWQRVDCPPETFAERLIIVPELCERDLAAGYITRAGEEGATVVRRLRQRHDIVAAALSALDGGSPTSVEPSPEREELAADFLALGFLYLQVELLTRRMRYMSNIDQTNFNQQVTSGAAAFVAGDFEETRRRLQNCFDVLAQAREHFYPVDAYLVDVVLVAATTLGPSLQSEIKSGTPVSLLITGEELSQMAERQPDTLAALLSAKWICRLPIWNQPWPTWNAVSPSINNT
jgi:alpha-mannosidase